jgi:hypothetical protein
MHTAPMHATPMPFPCKPRPCTSLQACLHRYTHALHSPEAEHVHLLRHLLGSAQYLGCCPREGAALRAHVAHKPLGALKHAEGVGWGGGDCEGGRRFAACRRVKLPSPMYSCLNNPAAMRAGPASLHGGRLETTNPLHAVCSKVSSMDSMHSMARCSPPLPGQSRTPCTPAQRSSACTSFSPAPAANHFTHHGEAHQATGNPGCPPAATPAPTPLPTGLLFRYPSRRFPLFRSK